MTDEERGLLDYIADNFDTDRIERDGVFVRTRENGTGQYIGTIAGSPHSKGYISIQIGKKKYLLHRLVLLWINKSFPTANTDHINHNKSDNRPVNLRSVTTVQNNMNLSIPKDHPTGVHGVTCKYTRVDGTKRWMGTVGRHGNDGSVREYFESKQAAVDFVTAKRDELGYHENHGKPKTTETTQCEV